MNNGKNYAAIILAAGLSSRMGDFKAMMPFDGIPAIVNLIRNFKLAGIRDIFVVTGHRADLLEEVIEQEQVRGVFNRSYEKGMFSSIKTGVAALGKQTDAFFLLPVDYPLIPARAFMDMMDIFDEMSGCFLIPCYDGKKGHPPLFPYEMAGSILAYDGEGGLKGFTLKHENRMRRAQLDFEELVMDMDTYEEYGEMAAHYDKMQAPDEKKCLSLLERYQVPDVVRQHSIAVAQLAVRIGAELNEQGAGLDLCLIRSAALLHDIAREQRHHWSAGAETARQHGIFRAAELIEHHMFYIRKPGDSRIAEIDVLCLADKQFSGSKFVTLKERAMPIMERFKDDPEALEMIRRRFHSASMFKAQILKMTGKTVEDIWTQVLSDEKTPIRRRIFLVRHGQTRRHREKIYLGQTDVRLSSQGREQAEKTAERLMSLAPKATKIYCSDLARSIQTAEIIAARLFSGRKQVILPSAEFREMKLGSWDGLYISEVLERYPEEYKKRGESPVIFKIDQDSENYYDLRYRAMKKLNCLIETETDEDIVLVAHAGVNAVIRSSLEHIPLEEAIGMKQEHGSIHVIELGGDKQKDPDPE